MVIAYYTCLMLSIIIYSNIKMNKNNTSNKNDNIKEYLIIKIKNNERK